MLKFVVTLKELSHSNIAIWGLFPMTPLRAVRLTSFLCLPVAAAPWIFLGCHGLLLVSLWWLGPLISCGSVSKKTHSIVVVVVVVVMALGTT